MQSYYLFREEINGLSSIHDTVKTIEKVAAATLHTLKQKVKNMDFYLKILQKALERTSIFYTNEDHPLLRRHTGSQKTLLIIGSNQGLVGGLYHNLVNFYLDRKSEYQNLMVIGKKTKQFLEEENIGNFLEVFLDLSLAINEEEIAILTQNMFNKYIQGSISQLDILYPQFVSIVEQPPTIIPFLPFKFTPSSENVGDTEGFPIFESSKKILFDLLLQKYIKTFFYKIILEAKLSEFSARTIAMEHAAQKSKDLCKKVTVNFFKVRRKIATQKQLESFIVNQTV